MERSLIFAAAVSAALHAGALFGIHRSPAIKIVPEVPTVKLGDFRMPPEEPPPEEERTETTADQKQSTEPLVPRSPEPVTAPTPTDFPQRPVPEVNVTSNLSDLSKADLSGTTERIARVSLLSGAMLDNPPRTRTQIPPVYPPDARRSGLTGKVLVEFVVDEEGRVHDPRVMNSSDRVFDEPTLRAISRWRFEPGRKDGRVVRFRMAVPVDFNLNE